MFGFLLSYFPSKVLLPLALWVFLLSFLASLRAGSTLLSGFLLVAILACLAVIVSRISDIRTVRESRRRVLVTRKGLIPWELEETCIDWLVDYLLRLRVGGCTVVLISPYVSIAMLYCFAIDRSAPINVYEFIIDEGETIDAVATKYLLALLASGTFLMSQVIYSIVADMAGASSDTVVFVATVGFVLNPMVPFAMVGRRLLSNRVTGYILVAMICMVSVALWACVLSRSFQTTVLLIVGIFFVPIAILLFCVPMLAKNLMDDLIHIPGRISACSGYMQKTLSQLAICGGLSMFGDGLREKNPCYSLYYSWRRRTIPALAVSVVAVIVIVSAMCAMIGFSVISYAAFFVILPIFAAADYLWEIAKRLRQRPFEELMGRDARPPILILRAFPDDKLRSKGKLLFRKHTKIFEVATKWCSSLGPVFMFGRPGELLAEIGPARMYVTNDIWQEEMTKYMDIARLLLIFVGEGNSLAWEIKKIAHSGVFYKTVFVFPPLKPSALSRRWDNIKDIFSEAQVKRSLAKFLQRNRASRIPLDAIDPTAALLVWYDKGTLRCLASKRRNRLAYDIAFKLFVEHMANPRVRQIRPAVARAQ